MDSKTQEGAEAEAFAILHFTKEGWHVFTQATGKAPCDLVIVKDNEVKRIQVKSTSQETSTGGFKVELKTVRHNSKKNTIKNFDSSKSDLLFIYIKPLGIFKVLESLPLHNRTGITIQP